MAGKYSPLPGDVIDAKLEPGEYVLNRNAVNAIGKKNLDRINFQEEPRFQEGGPARKPDSIGVVNKHKVMLGKLKKIQQDRQFRKLLKNRVPAESYKDHIMLREKDGSLMTKEEQMQVLDYFNKMRQSKPEMNEGGSIMDRLQAKRKFNEDQYNNPSVVFKNNSLFARMDRRDKADDIALRQATNERIAQYHDEMKAIEQRGKLRKLQMENALYGPGPLEIRKTTPIDLKSIELQPISTDDSFNSDDFNDMLGLKKTLKNFAERNDMLDSKGRDPFFDEDYGKMEGIDLKTFEMPKDRMLTPSEQLAMRMKESRNQNYNLYIDEDNPAVQEVYKKNPMLKLEAMNRADRLRQKSDSDREKSRKEIELEYSPYALHNADIREELIGDPNDPSDDYGSSMADAKKRSADRALMREQARDIEMMNMGTQPAYYTKDGKRIDDRDEYIKYRKGERAKELKRRADTIVMKDGIRTKKFNPKDNMFTNLKPKKVKEAKLPEGKKSMYREFIKGADQGRYKKSREMLERYVYQMGGKVRNYNLGAYVQAPEEIGETGSPFNLRRSNTPISYDFAPVTAKQIQGEGLMDQSLDKIGEGIMSRAHLSALGGAKGIAEGAKNRYGRGFTSGKNQAMEEIASKMQWGDKNWDDMSREEQIEASKQVRATGVGMDKYQKARMYGRGLTQAGSQIGQDLVTGAKGVVGGIGLGAAGLYKGAGKLYEGAGKAYEGAKKWYKDDTGHADYDDVLSGKAEGSNRQKVGKGLSMFGTALRQMSALQGFDPGDGFGQYRDKGDDDPGKFLDADEEDTDLVKTEEEKVTEPEKEVTIEELNLSTPKGPRPQPKLSDKDVDPYKNMEERGGFDLFGYQEGGHISLDSFIRQSWRNM